jgi:hypothetical protein
MNHCLGIGICWYCGLFLLFPLIPEYKINHGFSVVIYTLDWLLSGEFMNSDLFQLRAYVMLNMHLLHQAFSNFKK